MKIRAGGGSFRAAGGNFRAAGCSPLLFLFMGNTSAYEGLPHPEGMHPWEKSLRTSMPKSSESRIFSGFLKITYILCILKAVEKIRCAYPT